MGRKKVTTTIYITPEQSQKLKLLHDKTKVPIAEYIRQGIDMILKKNSGEIPGQLNLLEGLSESPHESVSKPDRPL